MHSPLTHADIASAAASLGVEPCAVRAVVEVESAGQGFLPDGRAVIRFEKHIFLRELKKRGATGEQLAAAQKLSGVRWDTLSRAIAIHEEAALCSASWGLFQIMGFNYRVAGFDSVHAFVEAQKQSEARQLESFCCFIRSEGLALFLLGRDWAGFARRYNGVNYAANQYDTKMRRAYERCLATGGYGL